MIQPEILYPLTGGAFGLVAGSFLSTLAIRWGRGETIRTGRSRCDGCARTLPPHALVPLVSYLAQRGRCSHCHRRIDRRHPLVELVCGLIGLASLAALPGSAGVAGALFGWLLATLALIDADHLWLPDPLVASLAAAGLLAGLLGLPPALGERAIGAAAGFGALALLRWCYRLVRGREGMGGGDPKLLGAIGAWLGWRPLPTVVLFAALLGLGWCLLLALRGRSPGRLEPLPLGTLLALAAWPCWLAEAVAGSF